MKKILNKKDGFTIIEMLVTTTIFVLMTTLLLANYPKFNSQVTVGRIAREMALSIREAQAFGLAIRQNKAEFPQNYGVYINLEKSQNNMIVFSELKDDYDDFYNEVPCDLPTSECVGSFFIRGDVRIRDICTLSNGVETVDTKLDTVFERANPDAKIFIGHDPADKIPQEAVYITLQSTRHPEQQKVVRVWLTGQISVQDIGVKCNPDA